MPSPQWRPGSDAVILNSQLNSSAAVGPTAKGYGQMFIVFPGESLCQKNLGGAQVCMACLWRALDLGSKRLIFTRFSLFLKEDFYRHYHWLDYSGKIRIFMEEADQCRLSPFLFSFSCKRGWSWCSKVKLRDLYANSQLKSVTANARPSSLLPQDLLELYCDRLFVFGIIRFIVMKGRGYGWWQ